MKDDEEEDGEETSGGVSRDVLKSYLAFGVRAVLRRPFLVGGVFLGIIGVTVALVTLWPRTYYCESRLMAQTNEVFALRGDGNNYPLRNAYDLVMRQDNLEAIVKQADLVHAWEAKRPFILKLKDAVMDKIRGPLSEKDRESALLFTLGDHLSVAATDSTLTFMVDWPDAETSARILEVAEENFLEARHVAEISTLAEYISILEGHATTLRGEVEDIAGQLKRMREAKIAAARGKAKIPAESAPGAAVTTTTVRRPSAPRPPSQADEDELATLKATLETKQRTIAELEDYRNRRLLDLQAKLVDLRAKYTPAHPAVVDAQQALLAVSQPSPQVTTLRADVKDLEAQIKSRSDSTTGTPEAGGGTIAMTSPANSAASAGAGPLPEEIMNLMAEDADAPDPAVAAQLRYAVEKYTTLRGQISSARIDLDTAQAAFNHRYKIVVPPQVPLKAVKPKIRLLVGAGIFAAVFFSLLSAIAAELLRNKIVARWQVEQISLPVLGELRFPPRSSD